MPDTTDAKESKSCLDVSLKAVASLMHTSDGREIPFTKAILTVQNVCDFELFSVGAHATLGQEGGTVQDVTSSLSQPANSSFAPGQSASWDVYDVLIPAHPGSASKIHMFGYRAALNWRFELAAWAKYQPPGSSEVVETPVSRWALKWSVSDAASGEVELTVEDLTG